MLQKNTELVRNFAAMLLEKNALTVFMPYFSDQCQDALFVALSPPCSIAPLRSLQASGLQPLVFGVGT